MASLPENVNAGAAPAPHAGKPLALPVRADCIPAEIRAANQWVCWKYIEDIDRETGEIDWDKPPLKAGGGRASSTNPETWSPFEDALAAYQRGGLDGLGFVLRDNPDAESVLVGIDLDHCRDVKTGAVADWARSIVGRLNTYFEVSPSGEGLRGFLLGRLPPHGRKKGNVEMYQSGRYVTVTGHHLEGTPATVEHRQAELAEVHREVFGERQTDSPRLPTPTTGADLDDVELIRRACEAKDGPKFRALWEGSNHGYSSGSEADLALVNLLAFWCGPQPERIDGLFRQSGLFRSKWNRPDYRDRTIHKALNGKSTFYERRPSRGRAPSNGRHCPPGSPPPAASPPPDPHRTDHGNAIRLVHRHGRELRHCWAWRKWLAWDGRRWRLDDGAEIACRAKDTVAELFAWTLSEMNKIRREMQGGPNAN